MESFVRYPVPSGVPGVGIARREAEHPRRFRCDQDRDWTVRGGEQHGVAHVVEAPIEADTFSSQERRNYPERLLEPADAVVGRVAEGVVLGVVPAGAEAKD